MNNQLPTPIKVEDGIKILSSDKIFFRTGHEDISLNSIEFRNRKYNEWRSSNAYDSQLFEPGHGYNKYYLNEEPIKCWKSGDNCIIQDGHRRYVEGLLQGYNKFLVEFTSIAPPNITPSNNIAFNNNLVTSKTKNSTNPAKFEFSNEYIDISSSKIELKK